MKTTSRNIMFNLIFNLCFFITFGVIAFSLRHQIYKFSKINKLILYYIYIEIILWGIQTFVYLIMIANRDNLDLYNKVNKFSDYIMPLVVLGNLIFGITQFWNPEMQAVARYDETIIR